jgi:hypothetical protein
LLLLAALAAGPAHAAGDDAAPRPPLSEGFASPDGRYVLTIAIIVPPGSAAAQRALGTLARDGVEIWRNSLPSPVRPRLAVVSDSGRVALFGRWENTLADFEITVLGPDGGRVAYLGREDIERAAGVTAAEIVPAARHGAWLDRRPVVQGERVLLGTAGRALVLDLVSGRLIPTRLDVDP